MIVRTLRFHGNLIGTPTEYGVQFGINCTALDQSKLSNFVDCTLKRVIVLVISIRLRASRASDFEITRPITP